MTVYRRTKPKPSQERAAHAPRTQIQRTQKELEQAWAPLTQHPEPSIVLDAAMAGAAEGVRTYVQALVLAETPISVDENGRIHSTSDVAAHRMVLAGLKEALTIYGMAHAAKSNGDMGALADRAVPLQQALVTLVQNITLTRSGQDVAHEAMGLGQRLAGPVVTIQHEAAHHRSSAEPENSCPPPRLDHLPQLDAQIRDRLRSAESSAALLQSPGQRVGDEESGKQSPPGR